MRFSSGFATVLGAVILKNDRLSRLAVNVTPLIHQSKLALMERIGQIVTDREGHIPLASMPADAGNRELN
jgi:hypothetical protein